MRKFKTFALLAMVTAAISACSSNPNLEDTPESTLFSTGQQYIQAGNYSSATRYFQAVETQYPGSAYSEQAQLNLIYAAYKTQDYTQALITADRFLQQHAGSPNTDYVLYMAALTNMSMGDNMIQDFFGIDRSTRETTSMKTAFSNFQTLVQNFPNSQYTPDALTRMAYIKDRLARHELEIAKFYAKRKAWVAVSNRISDMILTYPDTYSTLKALPLLQQAYAELGLTQLEQQAATLVKANEGKILEEVEKPSEPFLSLPSWLKFGSDQKEEKSAE